MALTAGLAVSMLPGTVLGIDDIPESPFIYMPIYAGGFVALFLAVGAIRASMRPGEAVSRDARPSTVRMVVAGIVGAVCLAAAAVASPLSMSVMDSDYGPGAVPWGYAFGLLVVAITIAASVGAWVAGHAIVHGRRRERFARMRAVVGT
jgi:hypothetical protein